MPRIRSKQVLGETPVNPLDLTTKEYVDNLVSSGGTGGSMTILDENATVLTGVTTINFLGIDVTAEVGGSKQVNVYIPSPSYAPFFNTGGASIPNISTTNRYISAPTSEGNPFKIDTWSGGQSHSTIRNSVSDLVYSTPSEFSIYDLSTTFTATVYDADGVTSLATHTITLDSNKSISLNGITITSSGLVSDFDRYKIIVSVEYQMNLILSQGGRFSIKLTHDNNGSIYDYTQNDIFRDSEFLLSNISGTLTVVTGTTVVTKQISGVYFYTTNTEWEVNLDQINNLNSRTYPLSQQLQIIDNNLFISETLSANGNDGDFVGVTWTNLHDNTNAEFYDSSWVTDQINQTNWVNGILVDTNATATIYDWSLTDTETSINYNYLIDTFVDLSDRNSEMFRSEDFRLESNLTTPWDSGAILTDGLQVINDRLVYPQYDFGSFEPSLSSQPDYTSISGNKTFYREYETNGATVSNGFIQFTDFNINETDLSSNNIMLDISINGTDWFTLNGPYIGGPLFNGSGCRINELEYGLGAGITEQDRLNFTLGVDFASSLYLRITYTDVNPAKYIGGLDFIGGNWI